MITNGGEIATTPRPVESIARWTPFDELTDLRHRMDELFTRAFGYTPLSRLFPEVNVPYNFEPAVDLYETDEQFEAFVSVPGFKPEKINVNATPDTIIIEGVREPVTEMKEKSPYRNGWVTGPVNFKVNYMLPAEIEPKKIKAVFEHGVLHIVMPKSAKSVERVVKVKVEPI